MRLRSLLFVPGDRPERFPKAAASGADALIIDLEDSVAVERKALAREAAASWLATPRSCPVFVRINPLISGTAEADLDAVLAVPPDALVLPKAEGADTVQALIDMTSGVSIPILPIATETPAAIFQLGSYAKVASALAGLTWGAEDLPAAIGAIRAREADGRYTPPYELARSLTLFGAHAAGVPAIETVYPAIGDRDGLKAYVDRARQDGFTGMMAIHPTQIDTINNGLTPSAEELTRAAMIVTAFETSIGGAVRFEGRMLDAPHLKQARRILAQAESSEFG